VKTEHEIRQALREWVIAKNGKLHGDQLDDKTPIIEHRIITSLQVIDLIVFLEKLTGRSIAVHELKAGVFQNINAIFDNFFRDSRQCQLTN
jgi:acyl carrier protein